MINQEIIGAPCKHGHIPFSCDRCTIEHLQKELTTLKASLPKIKADAVLQAAKDLDFYSVHCDDTDINVGDEMAYYANKLEAGELDDCECEELGSICDHCEDDV